MTAILLQGNEFFILDEPFNGVDIQSNIIITELIHKLKKLNKTVVISSHIFSTLSETCDEILMIKEGELIRKALRQEFRMLENLMIENTVGNKIDILELQ